MLCENCGLPEHALTSSGFTFKLDSPKEKFKTRAGRRTVWCCSGECVIQSLARNKYGETSCKWPVTLAEFRQLEGQAFLDRLSKPATEDTADLPPKKPSRRSLEYKQTQMARRTV
jgi:hypothetical protein